MAAESIRPSASVAVRSALVPLYLTLTISAESTDSDRHQIGRRVVFAELMLAVDEHEKIRLGRLIGGKRIAAVQQFLCLDACQPIPRSVR